MTKTTEPVEVSYWVTNHGATLPYDCMGNTHLINSFNLAVRTPSRRKHVPYLILELEKRGFKKSNPEWFI